MTLLAERLRLMEERLRPDTPLDQWTHVNTAEPDGVERLRAFGIELAGGDVHNSHDFLVRVPSPHPNVVGIHFNVSEHCLFVIEEPAHYRLAVGVIGSGNAFGACGSPNMPGAIELRLEYHGSDNTILFGKGGSCNGASMVVQGGTTIDVQPDCMLAAGITIRATDNHAMFDIATGRVLNPAADVTIGPHVWLCQEVLVLSGVNIGPGTIVGARSLVKKSLPAGVLAAGSPADIVRSGVSWTRDIQPTEAQRLEAIRIIADPFRAQHS